jgi:hypothetical protein
MKQFKYFRRLLILVFILTSFSANCQTCWEIIVQLFPPGSADNSYVRYVMEHIADDPEIVPLYNNYISVKKNYEKADSGRNEIIGLANKVSVTIGIQWATVKKWRDLQQSCLSSKDSIPSCILQRNLFLHTIDEFIISSSDLLITMGKSQFASDPNIIKIRILLTQHIAFLKILLTKYKLRE